MNKLKIWLARYRALVERCSTPGIMPPNFPRLSFLFRLIARTWVWLQVGRVKVSGKENLLAGQSDRIILCPNHSSYFDALVVFATVPYTARYMAAYDQFQGLGGLRALVMAASGAFPVDRSKGGDVIGISISALTAEHALVIFPEGKINSDGSLSIFKTGPFRIAMGVRESLLDSNTVYVVPMQICYAVRHQASAQGGYGRMGLKWRHGVHVNVGQPIDIKELAALTPAEASSLFRQRVIDIAPCPTLPDTTSQAA
ncbi:MAG: lysophospholipid acyltransferase family protein [Candidatus Obscuribacter sp.]|nr:lysophospholipid acyltransferase family protein [Candidatus Obscuribacter sp.]